jgi:TetR/AcrR family transcriptional repressor of nem operon
MIEIVEIASCAIRRTGYSGTGVADIMKEAGLTHGGFCAHFDSPDALLAEAGDRAGAEPVALAARVAAAAPPGQAPEVRRAATTHIKEMIDLFARCRRRFVQPR